ncbi:hypothetical protein AQZ52_02745 [Novosphingobium fuchskuhlense]|uniref:Uncharacterized protein n=2 Tax=Novosphingobium fuchskuhlense TaxID=1117702 RepID=A0A117UWN8_9SPHN|nr:hypothetical protein AQZ52_02745 [Novosphingobium fuchskuhlense]
MEKRMTNPVRPSPLDDPDYAAFAWGRYFRVMRWMGLLTLVVIALALAYLYETVGLVSIHLYIAAVLGIGLTMMLMAALMGLVFLSSGTGHDEAVDNGLEQHVEEWWS